jgi:hypothetical protein
MWGYAVGQGHGIGKPNYGADLFEPNERWTTRITRRKVAAELAIFAYPVLAELILHSDRARLFIVDESFYQLTSSGNGLNGLNDLLTVSLDC